MGNELRVLIVTETLFKTNDLIIPSPDGHFFFFYYLSRDPDWRSIQRSNDNDDAV